MPRFWVCLLVWASAAPAALQPTTTTLTLASGTPVYGSTVTIRAQVNANSGSITFTVDKSARQPLTVDANNGASLDLSLPAGSHTVGATFSAGATYQGSTATPLPLIIDKAATIVGLTTGPAQIGQSTNLTATVAVAGSAATVTGTVTFTPAAGCSNVPLATGIARCTTTFSATGAIPLTATFSGDSNTLANSAILQLNVSKSVPGVYLATSPTSPAYGVGATVSALVMGSANLPAPTGTITFVSGTKTLGTQTLGGDGRTSVTQMWPAGTYPITGTYSGDAYYQASPQVPISLTVGKAGTALTVSNDPAQVSQSTTLRATVALAQGTGTVGGTIDLSINGSPVTGCTGLAPVNGAVSCQTTFAQVGPLILTGAYSGDANTMPSTAMAIVQVNKASPGFYLAQSPASPVYGQSVTLSSLLIGATGLPVPSGTVMFSAASKILGASPVGTDGRATLPVDWAAGTYAVTATYAGDDNYQAPTAASLSVTVAKAPVTLVVSADAAQVGQKTTLRATVALAAGSGAIGGTVDFNIGGKPVTGCTGLAVTGGAVSCAATFAQLGTATLGGSFSGDGNTLAATATASIGVNRVLAGIYLAQAPDAPVYGQTVTLDCLLTAAAGMPLPTGTVTFTDGGKLLGAPQVGADGHASVSVTLGTGFHTIVAAFAGDGNYQSVTAPPMATTVTAASTATVLTAATGGPFTATVSVTSPGAGTPSGTVQFRSGANVIGTAPLGAQGNTFTAVLPKSSATGNITAAYSGDGNFTGSSSAAVTVNAAQTVVTVTSDHNPAAAGQLVNLTVTVSGTPQPATGGITGTVTVTCDGTVLGTPALINGQATLTATPAAGQHTITAQYAGNGTYPAGSGSLALQVTAAAASLTMASSLPAAVYGQPVTLTVTLPVQNGSVQFTDGSTSLGAATATAGTASLTVTLPVGVHNITATWAGDGTWAATTAQLVQTVNKAATSVTLGMAGGGLAATVNVLAPGGGSPGGTVRFLDAASSSQVAAAQVTGGVAQASLPSTGDAIMALYSGDANYAAATSATLHLLIATNAASYTTGNVAADELVTVFAPNLSGASAAKIVDSTGASQSAQLIFVSAGQATVLLPGHLSAGPGTLSITAPARTFSTPVTIGADAPGLFTADGSGQGAPAAQVIAVNADGTQSDPAPATVPIDVSGGQVYLVLYGTGIRHAAGAPVCSMNGRPAQVLYGGAQGSIGGLDQVNVLLPAGLRGGGTVTVNVSVDGVAANPVTLTIR